MSYNIANFIKGSQIILEVDPATTIAETPAYTRSCLVNMERNLSLTPNVEESMIPDCADLSKPKQVVRFVESVDLVFTGSGTLQRSAVEFWQTWAADGLPRACRIRLDPTPGEPAVNNNSDDAIVGIFVLRTFSITGQDQGLLTANIELAATGDFSLDTAVSEVWPDDGAM